MPRRLSIRDAGGAASDPLDDLLDDDVLQKIGNRYALYFLYGIIAALAVSALFRLVKWTARSLK